MNDSNNNKCPYCGGTWTKSPEHNGYEQWKCRNCGHTTIIKSEDDRQQLFEMGRCVDKMIYFVNTRRSRKMFDRINEWKDWQKEFNIESYLKKYSGKIGEDPLLAMTQIAHLTYGFQTYQSEGSQNTKETAESLYEIADNYLKENPNASNLAELVSLYNKKLKNKTANKTKIIFASVCGGIVACIAGFLIGMVLYSPSVNDIDSGINVNIPNGAISIFQKLNVDVDVEQQPQNSVSYIDAKNALRSETEKFELFDISLMNGRNTLNFDGSVMVTIPIPMGFDTSALKVFYVSSDETYEEMPATVSVAQNTISFETTHFSLYAVAERHPIVNFDTAGNGEVERQIVKRDNLAIMPDEPKKSGYTFAGWTLDGQKWDFSRDTVKKDITLVANWIPNKYNVTFEASGGIGMCDDLSVLYMNKYGSLPTLTKPGYVFDGWYTASENGTQITADTIMNVLADHTLYAVFTVNTNKVIFNSNGGEGDMKDFSLKTGETAKLPECLYTKTGYAFVGWSTTLTGDVVFKDNAQYDMGTEASYTLYAQWEVCNGVVKFNANGGDGEMENILMDYSQTKPLEANTFTRLGYDFIGWSTEPAGEVVYVDKAIYTMGDKSEYTLYAKWQKKNNELHFDANGGSGKMQHIVIEYDSVKALPINKFERDGYEFIGWSFDPVGEKAYSDGADFKMGADDEYTLYAMWAGKSNRFTFYSNGGVGNMPTDFTIATGDTKELPANLFSRVGYEFTGWSTEVGGMIKYSDGASYSLVTSGRVNLYANWKEIEYKISFDSNGGSDIEDKKYIITDNSIVLPNPTKPGYIFDGWYNNAEFTGNSVDSVTSGSYNDKKFYAKWISDTYTIEFDPCGGSHIDNKDYTIETVTFTLPTPNRNGYKFEGWFDNEEFTGDAVISIEQGTTGNKKYYASWSIVEYTVKFESNGGSDENDIKYNIDDESITLPIPSKKGYTFAGWYKNSNLIDGKMSVIESGSYCNMTVYAKWEAISYEIVYWMSSDESWQAGYTPLYEYTIESDNFSLATPIKRGYTFIGWYDNAEMSGEVLSEIVKGSTGEKTLYPKWQADEYTITFNSNEGSAIENIKFTCESEDFELPTTSQKTGYSFAGWYQNANLTGTVIETIRKGEWYGDITLYAKWTIAPFDIVYEGDGYSLPSSAIKNYSIEEAKDVTLAIPTKKGYEFKGWFDNKDLSGAAITAIAKGSSGNKYFYPKWEVITYSIEFESNGGSSAQKITYTVEDNKIDLTTVTREHYTFSGWYASSTLTNYVGAVYGSDCKNYKLYAKWTPVEYTITYDHRDNGNNSTTDIKKYNIESTFDLKTPVRHGYTFMGWYDNKDYNGEKIKKIAVGTTGNKTYYACWQANTYYIYFDSNGGSECDAKDYQITTPDFKLPKPQKEHYEFAGWYANESLGGEAMNTIPTGTFGSMTLYAKWTPKDYKIAFNTNGGVNIDIINYNVETEKFMLPIPVRKGYEFLGWYETADFGGLRIEYIYKGSNGDKTLTAKWSTDPIPYTATLILDGGTLPDGSTNPILFNVESAEIVLPIPSIEYYTFGGWYLDPDFTGSSVTSIPAGSTENRTYHAKWNPISFTITFVTNGGKPIDPVEYDIESNLSLKDYTTLKTGYIFNGWYTNEGCTGEPITEIQVGTTGNITLYCEWLSEETYNACFNVYKITETNVGTNSYTKGTAAGSVLPGDLIQMTTIPEEYIYNSAPHKFFYVMIDGHWDVSKSLTENDIVYGSLSGVGAIDERTGKLTVAANGINGKRFTIVVLDAKNGKADYSSYSKSRVFHFTIGTKNSDFAGGLGTESRPYLISNATHINNLANNTKYYQNANLYFKLTNDIDMNGTTSFLGIPEFYGHFDGDGYHIYNFSITSANSRDVAFFKRIMTNAVVKNLTIGKDNGATDRYSVTIDVATDHGWHDDEISIAVGGITGTNEGTIYNCFVEDVYVKGRNSSDRGNGINLRVFVGGVVGYNVGGTIQGCTVVNSHVDAQSHTQYDTSPATTLAYVGGLIGDSVGGSADDCYVHNCTIYAYAYSQDKGGSQGDAYIAIGALVGEAHSSGTTIISNCYAKTVTMTWYIDSDHENVFHESSLFGITSGAKIENCHEGVKP